MIKFRTNKWALMVCFMLSLLVMGCDEAYYNGPIESGKIELDFQNTTWYLEHEENLGSIYIKENGKFCIDKPLAEKLYYKSLIDRFGKKQPCGDFSFDKTSRKASFTLRSTDFGVSNTGTGGTVLRVPPKGIYFIAIAVPNGQSLEEGFLLQKY